jgi:hypothetical protein
VLTADDRQRVQARARAAIEKATLRKDPWWAYPAWIAFFLTVTIAYSTWAGLQTTGYFHEPYISPIFSPCLAVNCAEPTFRLIGEWWFLSPALLVMWLPIVFRLTCYYYRKAYYRAFSIFPNFGPPACAVREPQKRYTGETRFPFLFQNLHRYFFYLMVVNMVFLFWDTVKAFRFPDGWHVNVGSLVFVVMIVTMSLYMLSCHSCRHAVGGHVDAFSRAPLRYRSWKFVSRLNENHGIYALMSLFWIPVNDLYVRLLAAGVIPDLRLF